MPLLRAERILIDLLYPHVELRFKELVAALRRFNDSFTAISEPDDLPDGH